MDGHQLNATYGGSFCSTEERPLRQARQHSGSPSGRYHGGGNDCWPTGEWELCPAIRAWAESYGWHWDLEAAVLLSGSDGGPDICLACTLSTVHNGDAPTWASVDPTIAAVSSIARVCKVWRGNVTGAVDHIKDDAMARTPCSV